MTSKQFCDPHVIVAGSRAAKLDRIRFDDRSRNEGWYQQLLFENPSLLPVDDIEPFFGPLIPLAKELRTGKGPVDIVFINPDGYITLVETKLWRNPQARRDVVAQIIEYATGMAKWTYADLCNEVRYVRSGDQASQKGSDAVELDADPILSLVSDRPGFDETRFIDTVTRNLRLGRFLLLIVGDGIQEGVEALAETMQKSPHLHFTLALVETAVYDMHGDGSVLLAQPRVLARTHQVVRHVIEIRNEAAGVVVDTRTPAHDDVLRGPRARSITEASFYEQLEANAGKPVADFARWVHANVERSADLKVTWSKTGMGIWWQDESGEFSVKLIRLRESGDFSGTDGVSKFCKEESLPDAIVDAYQTGLGQLVGNAGRVVTGSRNITRVKTAEGEFPPLAPLAARQDEFWKVLTEVTRSIGDALAARLDAPKR